jgi:hypothetical protein
MTEDMVKKAIQLSIEKLMLNDLDLLTINANERSISHRIALYLEIFFNGWNIDCEYNRDGVDPKRLHIEKRKIESDNTDATTVFPDIIVHKRGTDQNILVIEIKKTSSTEKDEYDLGKLSAFKTELSYQFAVFLKLGVASEIGFINVQFV